MVTKTAPSAAKPTAPAARKTSRSRSSTSSLTGKRPGAWGKTPVCGRSFDSAIWPCPCAQTIESTLALMMRPGRVGNTTSAWLPGSTYTSSFLSLIHICVDVGAVRYTERFRLDHAVSPEVCLLYTSRCV